MHAPSGDLHFPDGPKLEFELLLGQLIERAHEVMDTQARLRNLISATNSIISDLDLETVLTSIAESARQLVGAKYAAMGVIGPDGHLEQFIHVGMEESVVAEIGHLPEGKGLLGALIQDPRPVRLETISSDQRSSGFPAHHPPMESFLGVPIRVRDEVYGNLYMTDHKDGEFTADDEEIAQAFAASAGIAIANARLFEESRFRERWSKALVEINRHMLANEEDDALEILVHRLHELSGADLVCIARPATVDTELIIDRATGQYATELIDSTFDVAGSVVQAVLVDGMARFLHSSQTDPLAVLLERSTMDEAMLVPFDISADTRGILVVARGSGREGFRGRDIDLASSFADQITLAVQRSRYRSDQKRVEQLEDRSRIARDLHDHVIQRLFAAGLSLQAVASGLGPGESADRIVAQIADIDDTIGQIRQTIFALKSDPASGGLRARIREVIERVGEHFSSPPTVRFLGPVDLMSDRAVTDDVVAVVTETLANVVRHAPGSSATVGVSTTRGELVIEVVDDGGGVPDDATFSGLANLRDRAERRGGSMSIEKAHPRGTRLTWAIPV